MTRALDLGLLAAGCASQRYPEYTPAPITSTTRPETARDVEISLQPLSDPAESRKYFGLAPGDQGIGIVLARLNNNSTNATYLVEKNMFKILLSGASAEQGAHTNKIDTGTAGGEATAMIGAAVGGMALLFAGGSMISHDTEVRRNLVSKELPDRTLAPGQSMSGFIFFQPVPKKSDWAAGAVVNVKLSATGGGDALSRSIPLTQ